MKQKWYEKAWVMWFCLIFIWPLGLWLLYSKREQHPQWKKIAGVTLVIFLAFQIFAQLDKKDTQPQNAQQRVEQATQKANADAENAKPKESSSLNITKNDYFNLSEQAIANALQTQVVGMNMMDYWEMEHPDNGTADVKGTFDFENKKHTFRARFGIQEKQLLLLKIDDKTVIFNEELQDKIMDAASTAKKN